VTSSPDDDRIERLAAALRRMSRVAEVLPRTLGYPAGDNRCLPPYGRRAASAPELDELFVVTAGVELEDLGNGHFIHNVKAVEQGLVDGPSLVAGRFTEPVVPFASDGGGTLFALGRTTGQVYCLPDVGLGRTYRSCDPRHRIVAPSLVGFVEVLADRAEAFLSDASAPDLAAT
jgi:hypothetical protein